MFPARRRRASGDRNAHRSYCASSSGLVWRDIRSEGNRSAARPNVMRPAAVRPAPSVPSHGPTPWPRPSVLLAEPRRMRAVLNSPGRLRCVRTRSRSATEILLGFDDHAPRAGSCVGHGRPVGHSLRPSPASQTPEVSERHRLDMTRVPDRQQSRTESVPAQAR